MLLNFELILFGITLSLLAMYFKFKSKKIANLPFGPSGLPIIGNILQIVKNPHLKLSNWAHQYGKMYTVSLAGQPALVVNDVKTMKAVFGSIASTGRFKSELFEITDKGKHGVANSEDRVWQEQQKLFVKFLKQFGCGTGAKQDPIILQECNQLCEWIDDQLKITREGQGIQLRTILMHVTTNTIWNMVTGERLKSSECQIVHLLELWVNAFNTATNSGLAFFSWLKYIAPEKSGYNEYLKRSVAVHAFVKEYFQQQKKNRTNSAINEKPNNIITAYIEQVINCADESSSFYGEEGFVHSFTSVLSMMVGGTETTSSSLNWLIFYLVAYPEIQKKVQEEIDKIVGTERNPSLTDRKNLPYLDAVVLEVLRISALVPFGIIHVLLDSVNFEEYIFPKGLILLANIYHANRDPNVWCDPEVFRPERFLEGNEAVRKRMRECVTSFQKGKRTCPGEQLAKDILFLFLARLLQKYRFSPENGRSAKEYIDPVAGYMLMPRKIGLEIKHRNITG